MSIARLFISAVIAAVMSLSFALVVLAQSDVVPPESLIDKKVSKEYVIQPNDMLEITVYDEGDLTKVVRVSQDLYITYPLLGRVSVRDMDVSQLEAEIADRLKKDFVVNPQVNVFVKEFSGFYIYGQVQRPGCYPLQRDITTVEAIAMAGGLTSIASANDTKIMREENGEKRVIKVKVGHITKTGDRSKDIALKPGDVIVVPESFF